MCSVGVGIVRLYSCPTLLFIRYILSIIHPFRLCSVTECMFHDQTITIIPDLLVQIFVLHAFTPNKQNPFSKSFLQIGALRRRALLRHTVSKNYATQKRPSPFRAL